MKCTRQSIKNALPNVDIVRNAAPSAVYAEYDPVSGKCTGFMMIAEGDSIPADQSNRVDCTPIIRDWMDGRIDHRMCVIRLGQRIDMEFDAPSALSGNPDSKIAQARLRRGITQKELAGMIGTTQQAINRWERGSVAPRTVALVKIADALDCDIHDLI